MLLTYVYYNIARMVINHFDVNFLGSVVERISPPHFTMKTKQTQVKRGHAQCNSSKSGKDRES